MIIYPKSHALSYHVCIKEAFEYVQHNHKLFYRRDWVLTFTVFTLYFGLRFICLYFFKTQSVRPCVKIELENI